MSSCWLNTTHTRMLLFNMSFDIWLPITRINTKITLVLFVRSCIHLIRCVISMPHILWVIVVLWILKCLYLFRMMIRHLVFLNYRQNNLIYQCKLNGYNILIILTSLSRLCAMQTHTTQCTCIHRSAHAYNAMHMHTTQCNRIPFLRGS